MTTPTGLPQKGDRIAMHNPHDGVLEGLGTVVARGPGAYYSLTIAWDDGATRVLVDGAGLVHMRVLRLITEDEER
jgi:hypothetical protein